MADHRCATREDCPGDHGCQPAGQRRTREGDSHPDRNAQFIHINDSVKAALAAGPPSWGRAQAAGGERCDVAQ